MQYHAYIITIIPYLHKKALTDSSKLEHRNRYTTPSFFQNKRMRHAYLVDNRMQLLVPQARSANCTYFVDNSTQSHRTDT